MVKRLLLLILLSYLSILHGASCFAQSVISEPRGIIKGRVVDKDTKSPLIGASVLLQSSGAGGITDSSGNYILSNIPTGNYKLHFSHIGYESKSIADIAVKSGETIYVDAELRQRPIRGKDISVTTQYFILREQQPTSVISFSGEEISRIAGSAGDVSKALTSLPSISRYDDRINNLIVRGGNHLENGFMVDNLEIPCIDHYSAQTGGGGVIGLLNMDLVRDLNFYSGGFPAAYGDRLSSYIDISLREGNRERFAGNLAMSLAGLGATFEGPIAGGRGSWLLSARRGYFDLLFNLFKIDIAPNNYDFQTKLVYDINSRNKVSLLGILGDSKVELMKDSEWENTGGYGYLKAGEAIMGASWRHIWSAAGFSDLSFSYINIANKYDSRSISTGNTIQKSDLNQDFFTIKNDNHQKLGDFVQLDYGLRLKFITSNYFCYIATRLYPPFYVVPKLTVNFDETDRKSAAYGSLILRPIRRLSISAGLRADYFSFNHDYHIAPRLSFSCRLSEQTSFNGAYGIYYQTVPMQILSQHEAYRNLKDIKSYHYILGLTHLIDDDIKLSVEFFDKEYFDVPIDTIGIYTFPLDQLMILYGQVLNYHNLVSAGRAYSQGIEFTVQKKMSNRLYGLAGLSYSFSQYLGYDGVWRSRITDNRTVISVEGGYRLGRGFEVKLRWDYAGGTPYTPLDSSASLKYGTEVYDSSLVNAVRRPDYHSLFVRIDKRFDFKNSHLIIYLSAWNLYDRRNVAFSYWDDHDNVIRTTYQLGFLPVLGFKYEF